MINVSIDGLFAPVLEAGLDQAVVREIEGDVRAAHRELMSRRGGDVGFYDLPSRPDVRKSIAAEVSRLRALSDDLLVLGIGGSSLGGQALTSALGWTTDRSVRVHFADNVDPDTFGALLDRLDPARTAALVITKSGTTVETVAQMLIVRRWLRVTLGQGEARSRMTFITDPTKGMLRELSRTEGVRAFEIPSNVVGRYSVLSPAGLLPAAYLGIDISKVLHGAEAMVARVSDDDVLCNPACVFAVGAVLAQRRLGRSSLVMMPYSDALRMMTSWFVQLWAESLGKRKNRHGELVHAGQTPIPAVGAPDQHAQLQLFVEGPADKVVTLINVEKSRHPMLIPDELPERPEAKFLHGRDLAELLQVERRATRAALLNAGVPVIDVSMPCVDEESLGALFVLFEAACACTGIVMGVNPFDQPGVEDGKHIARGLLGQPGYEEAAARVLAREARENPVS